MQLRDTQVMTADAVLERLLDGNRRFVSGAPLHPDEAIGWRAELLAGQRPFAAILTCSDSRVPPELIFDQGLGDLFVVRVAGNILDGATLGSLEYAAEHLDVPLIVVLGHSRCGAVQATVAEVVAGGHHATGHITTLVDAIRPAVLLAQAAEPDAAADRMVAQAVRMNVAQVVGQLCRAEPMLSPLLAAGKLTIVGAHYDLASGVVELLPERLV